MQPIPSTFPAIPTEHFLPTPTADDQLVIDSRPPVFSGFDCLRAIPKSTQPILQLAATSGDEKRWSPTPSALRSRTSAAVDHLADESRSRSAFNRGLASR
jgi:hypothetical protein